MTAYSADLLTDIHLEIRDIFPDVENLLKGFILSESELSQEGLDRVVEVQLNDKSLTGKAVDLLLWYCFLGIKHGSEVKYIYSTNYSLDILKALIQKKGDSVVYVINPGFYPALMIAD